MDNGQINYSQCWEDPDILAEALNIKSNDSVLSITSGGDNTLALLLYGPQKIIAVDLNPVQNYLLELKLAAVYALNYKQYLAFLGVTESHVRKDFYSKLQSYLTPEADTWWLKHQTIIKKGVINNGRFEKYLNLFRKHLLPLVHSAKTTKQFALMSSLEKQWEFYKDHWDTKRWRIYFRLATSRSALKHFARQKGMFKYTEMKGISDEYLKRFESNLNNIPLSNNYFLNYCLTGNFGQTLPAYLQEKNFLALRKNKDSGLQIVTGDLLTFLKFVPEDSFSKFNLSDIFEALSKKEHIALWKEIIRTAKKGAIIVYWDNLVPRPVPPIFFGRVREDKRSGKLISSKDRVFFYGGFHIVKVLK